MASDNEGIAALFSMYKDDDDEDEDEDESKPPSPPAVATSSSPSPEAESENPNPNPNSNPSPAPPSPPLSDGPADRKTLASPLLAPPPVARSPSLPPPPSRRSSSPFPLSSPSPLRAQAAAAPAELPRPPRRGALAIVDYAHDEMAMSPEQEEGEIMSGTGELGSDVRLAEGNLEERTLSGTVHILTPNTQPELCQHSNAPDQNQLETDVPMDVTGTETEVTQVEEAADVSGNVQNDDPLSRFLPPPVTTKCSVELQQKINRFLVYKKSGKSFNAEVRNRKDYRNPDFLQHAVRYQEINQIGTCFSKDVFDPYGYEKSDYYDEIEADMNRELDRREQEKKKSQKVEFVGGGIQPGIVAPILKNPAIAGLPQVPVAAEGTQKETRPNKKSKWDKIGDMKNPAVSAGHDNLSAVTMHAALLTAANVGAGYTVFAQQKRKEAEEKRTSDKKSDRTS